MSVVCLLLKKSSRWAGAVCLAAGLLWLSGCSGIDRLLYPTYTPLPTQTLHPSRTPTHTITPPPTATATPTPFAPAQLGTALPVSAEPLSADHVAEIKLLAAYGRGIPLGAVWSPDGKELAVASTGGVYLFSAAGGAPPRKIETGGAARSLAYAPDGSFLAVGGEEGQVTLFDPQTLAPKRVLTGQRFAVLAVAVSADGRWLASAAWDHTLWVWDLEQDRVQVQINELSGVPLELFFEEERLFAWSPSDPLKSWSLPGGLALPDRFVGLDSRSRTGSSASALAGQFAVDQDARVRVVYTQDGRTRALLERMPAPVQRVALLPGGGRLAALDAEALRIWDLETRAQVDSISVPATARLPGLLAVAPTGDTAAVVGSAIAFLSLDGSAEPRVVEASFSEAPVSAAMFAPRQMVLAALHSDGALQEIALQDGSAVSSSLSRKGSPVSAALSAGADWVAAAFMDRTIAVFNPSSGASLLSLRAQSQPAGLLALDVDARWLAAGVGKDVLIWGTADGEQVFRQTLEDLPGRLCFSPDGRFLAVEAGGEVTLWNTAGWTPARSLSGAQTAFSQDGQWAAVTYHTGDGPRAKLFSPGEDGPASDFSVQAGAIALSADGSLLASAGLRLALYHSADGRKLVDLPLPAPYGRVFFSPDGSLLGYAAPDGTLQVWGVER